MTNTVITRTKRFKAAASGAGHSLIVANYGHDIYQKWYNWELGVPWENRGEIRAAFATDAGREGHDADDLPRRPRRLERAGPQRRAVLPVVAASAASTRSSSSIPDTHHGGWSEEFEKDRLLRVGQWFDKYLKYAGPNATRKPAPWPRSRHCGRRSGGVAAEEIVAADTSEQDPGSVEHLRLLGRCTCQAVALRGGRADRASCAVAAAGLPARCTRTSAACSRCSIASKRPCRCFRARNPARAPTAACAQEARAGARRARARGRGR